MPVKGKFFLSTVENNPEKLVSFVKNDPAKLDDLIFEKGSPQLVLTSIKQILQKDNQKGCHELYHEVGQRAYKVLGKAAFSINDYDCNNGYIHGVVQAFIVDLKGQNYQSKIAEVCQENEIENKKLNCYHAIGHGLMLIENNNLPQALESCKLYIADLNARSYCYGGIFMENIVSLNGTSWVSSDLFFPCNSVDQNIYVQQQCYLYQASRMLKLTHFDYIRVASLCAEIRKDSRLSCFENLGQELGYYFPKDPEKISRICSLNLEHQQDCIKGSLAQIISFSTEFSSEDIRVCDYLQSEITSCKRAAKRIFLDKFGDKACLSNSVCSTI